MKHMIGEINKKGQDQPNLNLLLAELYQSLPYTEMAKTCIQRAPFVYIM